MLVVENGSGRSDAESYVSVVDFRAYCAAWGHDLTGKLDADCEAALRKAAAFIDTFSRFKGTRLSASQALEFPRSGLTDDAGLEITGVPARVIRACCDLAFQSFGGDLLAVLDRGGRVVSESVGPISTTFAADAPAGRTYQLAEKLLSPFARGSSDLNGPLWGGADAEPIFAIGMHDNGG